MSKLIINGRFRTQRSTGVQIYAKEIMAQLGCPQEAVPGKSIFPGSGHVWEQFRLPGLCRGKLLFSPANTGPVSVKNQVVTIHDAATLDHPEWFSPAFASWYGWLLPRLGKAVAKIITVSNFSRERLIERLGVAPEKIVVTYPGVGKTFQPSDLADRKHVRAKLGLERPYVLSVGSLDPRKNLPAILKVWSILGPSLPDHELVIVGGSSRIFRGHAVKDTPSRVRLTGYLPTEFLPGLYSGAELFLYLALYEGFGLPPLEAMACGCPVLCSSTTAVGEGAGPGAVTVHPEAVDDAAGMALELLSNEVRRKALADRGRSHAAAFTWDACGMTTKRILDSMEVSLL